MKHTIQWFMACLQCCAVILNYSHHPKKQSLPSQFSPPHPAGSPLHHLLSPWICPFCALAAINRLIHYMANCVWLCSLRITPSRICRCWSTCVLSLIWLNDALASGYTMFNLSVLYLMDIWIVSTCWVAWVVLLWTFLQAFLWTYASVCFTIYLGVKFWVIW